MPRCAGRTFIVTDLGPPITFADAYAAMAELSVTPTSVTIVQALPLLLMAHIVEAWCLLLARFPFLTKWLGWREPSGQVHFLQPSVFSVSIHTIVDDSLARKPVEQGGIGYKGVCTTLEGVCQQLVEWNMEQEHERITGQGKLGKAAMTVKGVAA
jgi:hypothetical protein